MKFSEDIRNAKIYVLGQLRKKRQPRRDNGQYAEKEENVFTRLRARVLREWRWFKPRGKRIARFTAGMVVVTGLCAIPQLTYLTQPIYASNQFAAVAHAQEAPAIVGETVDQLETEMADKLCGAESAHIRLDKGDLFSTYDPNRAMRAKCEVTGGVRPVDCESYGYCQEKVGTVMHYYPELYGKEISEIDALNCANDEECARKFFVDCSVKVKGCVWNWSKASENPEYYKAQIGAIRKLEGQVKSAN